MNLLMNLSGDKPVELGSLTPGVSSLFCFVDSADTPEDLLSALNDSGQNCFMVFVDDGNKGDRIDIVSLDGKQVRRMAPGRMVTKIPCTAKDFTWIPDTAKVRISNVEDGKVVAYPLSEKNVDTTGTSYLKIQGNPTPVGKVFMVNLDNGQKLVADDDLLVQSGVVSYAINLRYRL